ncbi:uncharacterized protein PGTG_22445 [Puccinia graminis f. sp. tritici CRL 75-36-700-3]|uniref:Uncharacterized protein n=1 Tax=Puccinia graminis f. sp. tritici (strain CRL 75-36-700-3 / race SCCL) TaxID=418459 RepID=H6QUG6_PUCGT|nr:uncharacterized protein PGTG_22445 [Puccinia graminis f. sp. tritici CRL 75-36-700-3]EHS64629.1 hypothetical protein PGTG_22445 [Puccinia graminis f. sp. tritici CRL 75-36-700-3]
MTSYLCHGQLCAHRHLVTGPQTHYDADGRPSSDVVSIRLHVHPTRLIGKRGRLDGTRNTANNVYCLKHAR